jgi:hypothetical protein
MNVMGQKNQLISGHLMTHTEMSPPVVFRVIIAPILHRITLNNNANSAMQGAPLIIKGIVAVKLTFHQILTVPGLELFTTIEHLPGYRHLCLFLAHAQM